MADMLGQNILPEEINNRRRNLRQRLNSLRDPVRRRREDLVPGPDIIGRAESSLQDLRRRVVGMDGPLSGIRERRSGGGSGSGNSGNSGESSSGGSSGRQLN